MLFYDFVSCGNDCSLAKIVSSFFDLSVICLNMLNPPLLLYTWEYVASCLSHVHNTRYLQL